VKTESEEMQTECWTEKQELNNRRKLIMMKSQETDKNEDL
jgi:hypothetical protein